MRRGVLEEIKGNWGREIRMNKGRESGGSRKVRKEKVGKMRGCKV